MKIVAVAVVVDREVVASSRNHPKVRRTKKKQIAC
jgi:hypothetical protein